MCLYSFLALLSNLNPTIPILVSAAVKGPKVEVNKATLKPPEKQQDQHFPLLLERQKLLLNLT